MNKALDIVDCAIRIPATLAMFCLVCTISVQAAIGPVSQAAQITATDGTNGDLFGASVVMNENTLVVGAPGQIGVGAAYVFTGSGTNWTQAAELTPSDGNTGGQFGYAVALSGNTVAVGAAMEGAVYVFVKPATGWQNMTETAKLTYPGVDLGCCVAFGGGGKFLVAGAFFLNAAYVFEKPASGWVSMTTPSANLVAPSGATAFGTALAASRTTAVVSAYSTNNESGAVYVFQLQAGVTNINASATLTPSDSGGFMGEAVTINGNTVVAGAQGHDNGTGAAYIFVEPTGGWVSETETAELGPGGQLGTAFGAAVAVYEGTIFVGRPSGKVGAVDEFIEPAGGWANSSTANARLQPSASSNYIGEVVAFNGTTLAVGDVSVNQFQGAVYLFQPQR
jgi:hypothetical protein